ncbi:MAG: CYTH domain-containing protein [Selenomonadaceae bacterium]|nr:CYTH domain-containing protein [Selenomonadaceae bacterium]MDY2685944.1 CYTH domain-containing protein [Selenomonadaceae bacterium]
MAEEIERKFLVKDSWTPQEKGDRIAQGYLSTEPGRTVRVRIRAGKGYLTVKGKNDGIRRLEFEYEVPLADAEAMLALCVQPIIEKTRYVETVDKSVWEIDVFGGANEGLRVAEVELPSADAPFSRPAWLGEEVSGQIQYYNSSLQKHPFRSW